MLPLGPALEPLPRRLNAPPAPAPPTVDPPAPPRSRQLPLWRIPLRRPKAPKPKSLGRKPLSKEEREEKRRLDYLEYPSVQARRRLPVLQMPATRAGCANVPRPCPFIHCRSNNYLTQTGDGVLKVTYPDLLPHQMDPDYSCAEDVVERGGATVEEVSYALNMTDERTRQLTVSATRKIKASPFGRELFALWRSGDI
jgi:hypothetical protein